MTIQNIAKNQMSSAMMRLASGKRINSAADDAAGLAITESMTAQIRGLDQGTRNTRDMQALVQTAEGNLETITDSTQRIRELSVQAANGTLTAEQRNMIQAEINQQANHIDSTVRGGAQYNTMNLLDGSASGGLHTASGADGRGATVVINDMTDVAQAVSNFNVTNQTELVPVLDDDGNPVNDGEGNPLMQEVTVPMSTPTFNINELDSTINSVISERANLGAMHNRFDYTANANSISSLNLADARSRIADADMAKEMMAFEQDRVLNEVQILMQRQNQDREEDKNQRVLSTGA